MSLPPAPNAHALAVLALTVLALVLFTRERIPLESSSFFVLISLAVGFEIFPFQQGGIVRGVPIGQQRALQVERMMKLHVRAEFPGQ